MLCSSSISKKGRRKKKELFLKSKRVLRVFSSSSSSLDGEGNDCGVIHLARIGDVIDRQFLVRILCHENSARRKVSNEGEKEKEKGKGRKRKGKEKSQR